ncbi:hypothetical protein CWI39_1744p0010, partial [Hamiltosporidium magnivora]
MYFLKLSENNQNFDFKTTNEDNLDSECVLYSLKALFRKYYIGNIKKLHMCDFSIDNSNVKAFSNLTNLKELNVHSIKFQNIYFSDLFCTSQKYNIKRLEFDKIKIFKRDLIFIANFEHIKEIKFLICHIYQETY